MPRPAVITTAATALTFAALTLATGLDLGWIGALDSSGDLVQWTSLPTGLGMAVGYLLRVVGVPEAYEEAVLVARLLGLAAFAVIGVAMLRRAYHAINKPGTSTSGRSCSPAAPRWPRSPYCRRSSIPGTRCCRSRS